MGKTLKAATFKKCGKKEIFDDRICVAWRAMTYSKGRLVFSLVPFIEYLQSAGQPTAGEILLNRERLFIMVEKNAFIYFSRFPLYL